MNRGANVSPWWTVLRACTVCGGDVEQEFYRYVGGKIVIPLCEGCANRFDRAGGFSDEGDPYIPLHFWFSRGGTVLNGKSSKA